MASQEDTTMASPLDAARPSTSTADDDSDMNMIPLTMDNSLVGKLNEGRHYINKAGEEFQKCVARLEESQIESIRQTHVRLTDQMREVKSTQEFPRCINPKNIHKAHRFADEARHFHKHIVIMSPPSKLHVRTARDELYSWLRRADSGRAPSRGADSRSASFERASGQSATHGPSAAPSANAIIGTRAYCTRRSSSLIDPLEAWTLALLDQIPTILAKASLRAIAPTGGLALTSYIAPPGTRQRLAGWLAARAQMETVAQHAVSSCSHSRSYRLDTQWRAVRQNAVPAFFLTRL
ncbi:hypothetical protein FB451DRAFT_1178351 [Mycena latifolia]|nr:hypothetical protein FB451DRAFT_1178351 [Mycena latifolia]